MNENAKSLTKEWFYELRDIIIKEFQSIENDYSKNNQLSPKHFTRTKWDRKGGGGGEMSVLRGNLFEKVGVNVSTVHGKLDENFKNHIKGASSDPNFYATGISVVSHMYSPLIPAAHFNTRFITTTQSWFGGGADMTPLYEDQTDSKLFHQELKNTCNKYNSNYYPNFKKKCDDYFYLPHRNEARGSGGIFFDYLNNNDFKSDFNFVKDIGNIFYKTYTKIIKNKIHLKWTNKQRNDLLLKRGRYVEFNLLYDRGTKFGFMTGGNPEAILMSLPPIATW